MSVAVVALAPGVWRLPLLGDFLNGFMFRDSDGQITLLDMGIHRSGPRVLAALEAIGAGPHEVTRLLLTHAHADHAGGAAQVSRATARGVSIHVDDAAAARSGVAARGSRGAVGRLLTPRSVSRFEAVTVAEELHDGQLLDVAGGLRVIHTPGHSPGHAAYLHEPTGVLVTGDSIFNVRGVRWPVRAFCSDFRMTQHTARRLVEIDYATAAFTHGPELRDQPRRRIADFLAKEGMIP